MIPDLKTLKEIRTYHDIKDDAVDYTALREEVIKWIKSWEKEISCQDCKTTQDRSRRRVSFMKFFNLTENDLKKKPGCGKSCYVGGEYFTNAPDEICGRTYTRYRNGVDTQELFLCKACKESENEK